MTLEVFGASRPQRDSDILPYDDGMPLETTQHRTQMNLLIDTLKPYLAERGVTAYVAGNNFLYYQKGKPPKFCGRDFYVVLGREETDQKSYVVWEEDNRFPDIIVELLSESTESIDRGSKFIRYRDLFKTAEYYLYDPLSHELEGYRLDDGRYRPISPVRGVLHCEPLNLGLTVRGSWLRWITPDGLVLPTGDERAEEAEERAEEAEERAQEARELAEQERERAEQEQNRAEALARKLREMGIDPDTLS